MRYFYPGMYGTVPEKNKIYGYARICSDLATDDGSAYFHKGWENDIYCCFAHRVAKECHIPIEYELKEKPEDMQCTIEELTTEYELKGDNNE